VTATELLSHLRKLNFTLSADNGKLVLRGPKEALTPALRAQLTEQKSEILALLKDAGPGRPGALRPRGRDRDLCLSFAQQRLWFLDQLEPGKSIYNVPGALRLKGPLDAEALRRSLEEIVRRHEALRTTFASTEAGPVQVISPLPEFTLAREEIHWRNAAEAEAEIHRRIVSETSEPFDLTRGPLFRARLIRVAADDHVLLLTMHHIVSDGWSVGVLYRELSALYRAFLRGEPSPLPELPIQYADFAAWQREWLSGAELERQLAYWKNQLSGIPALLDLPTDRPRPAVQTFRGRTQSTIFGSELLEALRAFNRREGVTLFMSLLAALQTLLYRYTGQEDIVVGAAIANRNRTEVEGLIGFFVNTLALRARFAGDPTFREFLASVRRGALEAYEHQDLPFEKLVEELNPHRTLSYTPIFQVMFVLQNASDASLSLDGLSVARRMRAGGETAKFDLTLSISESAEGLRVSLQYNTDLFDEATITRLLGHYERLLAAIVEDPNRRLSELPLLPERERRRLLVEWNQTARQYPRERCVHELFEAQAEKTPEKTALVFKDRALTYAELNRRANQLARYLAGAGLAPNGRVGVCLERGFDLIVALLGILKAGGAYVPLDPGYPKERLQFMLEDTGASLVLTDEASRGNLPGAPARKISLDREWKKIAQEPPEPAPARCAADDLAYVMYTSGSTGVPKGVEVRHRGIARLVCGADYARLDASRTFLQLAPISFDASTFEIWGPLLNGGSCVLFPGRVPGPGELEEILKKHQVSTLWLTAALFNALIDAEPQALAEVSQLLIGGEALSVAHVRKGLALLPNTEIINGYGPTESTTFACCYSIPRPLPEDISSIPIGRPIANTEIYILDGRLNPAPIGVAGELYIGGDGLARGYLNQPALTEEKFIAHPFNPGARLYKTGDRARYLPDGNIEFLGRLDDQVKIRGYRIELGEIETVLCRHPAIRQAALRVHETAPGDKSLTAYIVSAQTPAPTHQNLRNFLSGKLPDYMIPSAFVLLDSLPLNSNGKVDKKALGLLEPKSQGRGAPYVEPRNPIEWVLAAIWGEVLNLRQVGVHDDFFDLGGHSLLAIRLIAQIREECQVDLSVRQLFEAPTISAMAARLARGRDQSRSLRDDEPRSRLIEIQRGSVREPVFIVPGGLGNEAELLKHVRLARLIGREYSFVGLVVQDSNQIGAPYQNVADMAADYLEKIRSYQATGPYFLIGECIGGIVAYEMACQLRKQNQEVALLVLMDTSRPTLVRYFRYRCKELAKKIYFGIAYNYYVQRTIFHVDQMRRMSWQDRARYLVRKSAKGFSEIPTRLGNLNLNAKAAAAEITKAEEERYFCALRRYRPKRYDAKVTMIVNEERYSRDPRAEWADLSDSIEVQEVPGSHDTYLSDHVRATSGTLKACLDRARIRD